MKLKMSDSPGADKVMSPDAAQALAIDALAFIAAHDRLLPRFLSLTGIAAQDIRRAAAEPGFLAGVLRFVMAHEPTLMEFCAATGALPGDAARALRALPQGSDDDMSV